MLRVFEYIRILFQSVDRAMKCFGCCLHHIRVIVMDVSDKNTFDLCDHTLINQFLHGVNHPLIATIPEIRCPIPK